MKKLWDYFSIVSAAVNCWSQLQHTAYCEQQTKLTLSAECCVLCSFHYEPMCVLKYGKKTKTLGKDPLTQFKAKGGQIVAW